MLAVTWELSQHVQLVSAQDTAWLCSHPTKGAERGNKEFGVFPMPPQAQAVGLGLLPWSPSSPERSQAPQQGPEQGLPPAPPHKRPSQDLQPFTAKGSHLPQPFTSRNSNNPLITTWKNTVSEKKKKIHQPFPSSPTQPAPPTAAYPSCLILLLSAAPICALEG